MKAGDSWMYGFIGIPKCMIIAGCTAPMVLLTSDELAFLSIEHVHENAGLMSISNNTP